MAELRVTTLKALGAGSIFTYGGIRWLVLEQSGAAALSLAVDLLPDKMPFDKEDRNDWAVSTLREYLNGEFLKQLVEDGADAGAFTEMVVDLTSDDGLDDYGTDRCKIALISDAQYRRFRRIIPKVNNWWWTITPFSTEKSGYSRYARVVNSSGALDNSSARYGNTGARPLCNLKHSAMVSFDPEEATNHCGNERSDAEKRAEALDMMRHIVTAWDFKPEELAGIFTAADDEAEPEGVEPPEAIKAFMRDVLGLPEETVNTARAKKMSDGGFGIEVKEVEAQQTAASKEKLHAEFESLITSTRERFEKSGCGFNTGCFTALAIAYGIAIVTAKEGGE